MKEICIPFELARSTKKPMSLDAGNEMISSNDRLNFHVKGALAAHLRQRSNIEARQYVGDLEPGTSIFSKGCPCHIIVEVFPPSDRRQDAPNWYPTIKPLIDGLTDMGIFEDDNNKVITSVTFVPRQKSGTKKYLFYIRIREGWLGGI